MLGLTPRFIAFPSALVSLPLALHATSLLAAPSIGPKETLEQSVRDATQLLGNEKQGTPPALLAKKIRPLVEKVFHFESLTKRALGQGWKDLNADQQHQAISLFSEILLRKYAVHFVGDEKPKLSFSTPIDLGNNRMEVPSTTMVSGNAVSVLYRVEAASNTWRIYDVSIEGVSLVSNYRAQFDSIRQKHPGDGESLLKIMRDTLAP